MAKSVAFGTTGVPCIMCLNNDRFVNFCLILELRCASLRGPMADQSTVFARYDLSAAWRTGFLL